MDLLSSARRALLPGERMAQVRPVQPDDATVREISAVHDYRPDAPGMKLYGNNQATIVVDDVPFSAYWQLKSRKFVFHPMVWGGYVHSHAGRADFVRRLPELSQRMGTDLPNGGLAFFYPNHYPLSRMSGPEYMYSAISQSEALSGYLRAEAAFPEANLASLTDRVRDALFFPHECGGVDIGVCQLELPLMHANPEIILNGWLHSLFNLVDYCLARQDAKVAAYVERNLAFFLEHHECWYDSRRSISRYSETCPQRIVLRFAGGSPSKDDASRFAAIYRARSPSLSHYGFDLKQDFENRYGGFDNRVTSRNERTGQLTAVTTCSGLFDTFIVSDAPFELSIRPGGYDPACASPDGSGEWRRLHSAPMGEVDAVKVELDDQAIFRGYPTNFAKANGRNFYHVQHIVALAYLAGTAPVRDASIRSCLQAVASRWHERTRAFVHRPHDAFETVQTVLDAVNRGKLMTQFTKADQLNLD